MIRGKEGIKSGRKTLKFAGICILFVIMCREQLLPNLLCMFDLQWSLIMLILTSLYRVMCKKHNDAVFYDFAFSKYSFDDLFKLSNLLINLGQKHEINAAIFKKKVYTCSLLRENYDCHYLLAKVLHFNHLWDSFKWTVHKFYLYIYLIWKLDVYIYKIYNYLLLF